MQLIILSFFKKANAIMEIENYIHGVGAIEKK